MVIFNDNLTDFQYAINAFDGAITTTLIHISHPTPPRAFAHCVVFDLTKPYFRALAASLSKLKPPLHFHPYQSEYITVTEGSLGLTVGSQERILRPADGEICVPAWCHHRLYPVLDDEQGQENRTRFILKGQQTDRAYRLDTEFLQNWYGYQDSVLSKAENGGKMDLVQVLCMFDAGGSYLSLPWWVPFGRTLSMLGGILVGRWIGGLIGYQPYHKQWTTDWKVACEKMRTSLLHRRFADHASVE